MASLHCLVRSFMNNNDINLLVTEWTQSKPNNPKYLLACYLTWSTPGRCLCRYPAIVLQDRGKKTRSGNEFVWPGTSTGTGSGWPISRLLGYRVLSAPWCSTLMNPNNVDRVSFAARLASNPLKHWNNCLSTWISALETFRIWSGSRTITLFLQVHLVAAGGFTYRFGMPSVCKL